MLARVDLLQGLGEPSSLHQRHHLAGASFQQVAMCFDLTTPCSSAQSDLAVKGGDVVAIQIQDLIANLTTISVMFYEPYCMLHFIEITNL